MTELRQAAREEQAGNHDGATKAFRGTVEQLRHTAEDRATLALALGLLAEQMERTATRSLNAAMELQKERAEVGYAIGDYLVVAQSYCAIGAIEQHESRSDNAADWWLKAVDISRAHDLKQPLADALQSLGIYYRQCGELESARAATFDAIDIAKSLNDEGLIADITFDVACLEEDLGNEAAAREAYEEALQRYRKMGNSLGVEHAHVALARLGVAE